MTTVMPLCHCYQSRAKRTKYSSWKHQTQARTLLLWVTFKLVCCFFNLPDANLLVGPWPAFQPLDHRRAIAKMYRRSSSVVVVVVLYASVWCRDCEMQNLRKYTLRACSVGTVSIVVAMDFCSIANFCVLNLFIFERHTTKPTIST